MQRIPLEVLRAYTRHFPIEKGKGRLINALWRPLSFGVTERLGALDQADVLMACDVRRHIQRQIYFRGAYERADCAEWARRAKDADVIFDVGANIGVYSLLAAKQNPKAAVFSFEPTSETATALQANADRNGLMINVERVGVSNRAGTAVLNYCGGGSGENEGMNFVSDGQHDEAQSDHSKTEEIEIVTLDGFCEARGIKHIDLMKMDIEGSEYAALEGALGLLKRKAIGCLLIELTEWSAERLGHSTQEIAALLEGAGYGLHELVDGALVPWREGSKATNAWVLPIR